MMLVLAAAEARQHLGPYTPVVLECSEMLLKRCPENGKLLLLYFTTLARGIGAIDVARYFIANGAEKFYLDAARPVPTPLVHEFVFLEKHNATHPPTTGSTCRFLVASTTA